MKRKYRRLTIDTLNDEGCLILLSELLSALRDEYTEFFGLSRRFPSDKGYADHVKHLDEFIKSEYFGRLTGLDGAAVIDALRSGTIIRNPTRMFRTYQSA